LTHDIVCPETDVFLVIPAENGKDESNFVALQAFVWVARYGPLFSFTTKLTKDTKVSDICKPKLLATRSTGKENRRAVAHKSEDRKSFVLLAVKSSFLRALRVLRGESFSAPIPEKPVLLRREPPKIPVKTIG
jgi:hypothetical protein